MQFLLINRITNRRIICPTWQEVESTILQVSRTLSDVHKAHIASAKYGCIVAIEGTILVESMALPMSYSADDSN